MNGPAPDLARGPWPDVSEKLMFKDHTLHTTGARAFAALLAGAFVGAIGVTILYLPGHWPIWRQDSAHIIAFWTEAFAANLCYFSIALFLVGPPFWFLAHRLGFRSKASAVALGVALSIAVLILLVIIMAWYDIEMKSELKAMGFWVIIFPFVAIPLTGAGIALTIWRIAYRRPTPC